MLVRKEKSLRRSSQQTLSCQPCSAVLQVSDIASEPLASRGKSSKGITIDQYGETTNAPELLEILEGLSFSSLFMVILKNLCVGVETYADKKGGQMVQAVVKMCRIYLICQSSILVNLSLRSSWKNVRERG